MTSPIVRGNKGARFVPSMLTVAARTLRKFVRTPQLIIFSAVNAIGFLVVFRYVFGGAVNLGGLSYVDFMIPGFVTAMVLFQGLGSAAGAAEDIEHGFFDRLRSLPIARGAIIAGRVLADTVLVLWAVLLTSILGFVVGFRLHASLLSALAALGLCVLFAFAFEWMFVTVGLFAGNAQAAQGMTLIVMPLTFVSSAYVPVSTMPSWLQGFADNQPITVMVNAVRSPTDGALVQPMLHHDATYFVWASMVWTVIIIAIFAPLAIARFNRR
ncbi:MAG: ABC transporter permease [Nitrososphaerota archaeon]